MKLAVIGAGGFRMPALYESLLGAADRLGIADLVLHDTDAERLARIAPVLDGLDAEHGASLPRRATTALDDALEDADVVYSAVRAGGVAARLVDESVPVRHGVIGQETTGPGGIAFALRTVPVMQALARSVAERDPRAVVVNFTNPAGLVTEAMQRVLGDRVIGICDAPPDLCRRVATGLGRTAAELSFSYAGLNHLGWLTAARDGDGRDLLPDLLADGDALAATEEGQLFGVEWLRTLGAIPNEYLYYYYRSREAVAAMQAQGTRAAFLAEQQSAFYEAPAAAPAEALAAWRRAKLRRETTYMRDAYVARGADLAAVEAARAAGSGGYGAVAIGVVEAVVRGVEREMILNVANRGSLPFLDDDAVVEVACAVGRDGVRPLAAPELPAHARGLVESVKAVERLAIAAAEGGSRRLAHEALALHPLVASIDTATAILDGYVEGHPDLRELLA